MTLIFMEEAIPCARAVKDEVRRSVHAYGADGIQLFQAVNVADFSLFSLEGGHWSLPAPTPEEDMDAMLVDHEYRLTLLELGLFDAVI